MRIRGLSNGLGSLTKWCRSGVKGRRWHDQVRDWNQLQGALETEL